MTTRLILVRHGETTGLSSVRYYGATDVELSDLGRAQARAVAERLVADRPHLVITSRLRRAIETGSIVARRLGVLTRAEEDWNEVDFGAWEGLTRQEISTIDPAEFDRWVGGDPEFAYPGGGTHRNTFRDRVSTALDKLFLAEHGRSLVLVSHAGVLRVALCKFLGLPYSKALSIPIDLASIHLVEKQAAESATRVVTTNEVSHLDGVDRFLRDAGR